MATYTKIAVKGAFTVLVISLLAGFGGYFVRLVLARGLSVEDFGLFNSVFSFLGLIGFFKSLGFDKALIKFIPEFRHEKRNDMIKSSIIYVTVILIITNLVIISGVYLLSDYLAISFFHSPQAVNLLKLLAIAFFIDSFVYVVRFAFQGFKEMTYFSVVEVARMLLILAIVMTGFKLGYGRLSVAAFAYILTPIILIIAFTPVFLKKVFPEFSAANLVFDRSIFKKIGKYGLFVVETSAAGLVLYYTDIMALTYFSDLKAVGLYAVALPTVKIFMFFPRAIGGILVPLTSELWVKGRKDLLKAGIESLYKYPFIIIVPLVLVMFSFADLILGVLYGASYIPAANAMRILSLGMIFAIIYGTNIDFFAGIGKPQITTKIVYTAAFFNFIANIILIPLIGIMGAAISTTLSYLLMMSMGLVNIRKFIDISFPKAVWIKTFLAGIIFIVVIWILKKALELNVWVETALVLVISSLVYIALLFILRIIDMEELKGLYKRVVK